MKKEISRRRFLKIGVATLGTAALCGFESIGMAGQVSGSKALMFEELKEKEMPHVIVKLWPGKSGQQKAQLADAIVNDIVEILRYGEDSISVAIEEVKPEDWAEEVYKPDIINKQDKLYKKPGYSM